MTTLDDLNQMPDISQKIEFNFTKGLVRWTVRFIAFFIGLSFFLVLLLKWLNPPTTSFILQRQFQAWRKGEKNFELHYRWASWASISQHLKMAAITSEDQRFAYHWGLDLESIEKAVDEYQQGKDLRGASTITQQVAKNLFLWQDQSYIRKGIEAYFALLIELCWSKERILEIYLNIAEFGNGIYGAQAAAKQYFRTTAALLSKWQSALMVTALPAPKRYDIAHPSAYMYSRERWVLRYMDLLGEKSYLQRLK
ncbi:MAG: monofunctional biosynthetic peptidoglycan transglycosylase [Balneolaceae bacterium]|jgi:monofunctional biosynthetic peptidoglycan transglycosylase